MTTSYVLVVDDRRENLRAMALVLKPLKNISIIEASSGEEALQKLIRYSFAVILLDINMPNMSGYEVAELVSGNADYSHIPIVMVTAQATSANDLTKAYESGAVDYIAKPLEPVVLLNKVSQFVTLNETINKTALLRKQRDNVLNAVGDGVIEVDAEGAIQYANKKACELLGKSNSTLTSLSFDHFFQHREFLSDDYDCFKDISEQASKNGAFFTDQLKTIVGETTFPIEMTATQLISDGSSHYILLFQNISQRLAIESEMLQLANYDPLTKLANRSFFYRSFDRALARSTRMGTHVGLLFLDLDHFKQVNDTLGHDIGDKLLIDVSQRLADTVRETDVVSRLGGDEFAIVLEDMTHEDDAAHVAKNIIEAISRPFTVDANQLQIGVSIGISNSSLSDIDATTLVKNADIALYAAKFDGRNSYKVFDPEMSDTTKRLVSIEQRLRMALGKNEFQVYYQPQMSIGEEDRLSGFEALIRWIPQDSNETIITPDVFIPIAERSYVINDIGWFVLDQACQQLVDWSERDKNVTISVNLSAKQLVSKDCISKILEITNKYSIDKKTAHV